MEDFQRNIYIELYLLEFRLHIYLDLALILPMSAVMRLRWRFPLTVEILPAFFIGTMPESPC